MGFGKTECFLLPVIQNAMQDSVRFRRAGLTALIVYPMNALANDQEERVRQYLQAPGRLGRYFGNRPQFWLDLQSQYEIAVVEKKRGAEIARRVRRADAA